MTGQGDGQQGEQAHEWGEAVPVSSGVPKPGDIITQSGLAIPPEPLVGHDVSTPLEEDEPEHTIPPGPLWAMKDRRHTQWHLLPAHQRHERRSRTGIGRHRLGPRREDPFARRPRAPPRPRRAR